MSKRTCNKLGPHPQFRCYLDVGHEGDHRCTVLSADEPKRQVMMEWPNQDDKPKPAQRKTSLRSVSDKQAERTAFLAGVKAERLLKQYEAGERYHCERKCGQEFWAIEQAWRFLTLHHRTKRSQGQGYRGPLSWGVDHPHELELLCGDCHQSEESEPQWSGSA